jgi:hypothetical protein
MTHSDERPILVCRLECPAAHVDSLDAWMPKHFDDSLVHPAVTSAANYAVIHDFERLPAIFNGHGNRFIVYVADDVPGLMQWLDSPQIREAIEDGVDRESKYPPLDDEPFTGNIYEVMEVRGPVGADVAGRGPIMAERFEVPPSLQAEFDAWLNGPHLDPVESWPEVRRVRTWRQKRDDVPKRFPYERYVSKGNRMIVADFAEDTDLRTLFGSGATAEALSDSTRWDTRLPYVRREVCEFLLVRYPEDAAATVASGDVPTGVESA